MVVAFTIKDLGNFVVGWENRKTSDFNKGD
jgi:hypothetical protein